MSTTEEQATTTTEQDTSVDKVEPGNLWKRESVLDLPDGRVALIRLPNQFQHADIRQAAMAAKARRMRQLRDKDSDAYVVLEADMDLLLNGGAEDIIIDELVGREWWRDHLAAMEDVKEEEQFEHIERDQDRWQELDKLGEGQRDEDEFASLDRHLRAYNAAVEERAVEIRRPKREAFANMGIDKLVSLVRDQRVEQEGKAIFNLHFSLWQVFTCSFELQGYDTRVVKGQTVELPQPGAKLFAGIEEARTADPNMLDALTNAFAELESSYNDALQGNS